jgi:hypothetical protein
MTEEAGMPSRVIRLLQSPDAYRPGLLVIAAKRSTQYYVFKEIPCEIGARAFAIHRLGLGDVYHVRVGAPHDCSCECLGFLRHGHCKHVQGLSALVGHGLI